MKPLHTPGPWILEESYQSLWIWGPKMKSIIVYKAQEKELKPEIQEENRANARLIAAAPEMFHLLNSVLPYLQAVGTNGNHWAELIESCLAKATGEKELNQS